MRELTVTSRANARSPAIGLTSLGGGGPRADADRHRPVAREGVLGTLIPFLYFSRDETVVVSYTSTPTARWDLAVGEARSSGGMRVGR